MASHQKIRKKINRQIQLLHDLGRRNYLIHENDFSLPSQKDGCKVIVQILQKTIVHRVFHHIYQCGCALKEGSDLRFVRNPLKVLFPRAESGNIRSTRISRQRGGLNSKAGLNSKGVLTKQHMYHFTSRSYSVSIEEASQACG